VPGPALRRLVTTMARDDAGPVVTTAADAASARVPPVAVAAAVAVAVDDGVRAAAMPAGIAAIAAQPATPTAAPPMRTVRDTMPDPASNSRPGRRRLAVNGSIIISLLS
jgi:hypothetical protein